MGSFRNMKFGVLLLFSWPDRRNSIETIYSRALDRVEIMDKTGYDAVWLAEHHFTEYSVCPSVHMMALVAAERTKNIRIGTGISLVPFYDPIRLAEEVAMLDVLSGGRVNWGAGRGYHTAEFDTFGVDPKKSYDLFRENLEVVKLAWTEERFSFKGEFNTYEDVEVIPKPLQQPHPPIWLAASSPEAIGWAGRQGYSILMDPVSTHEQIGIKRGLYADALAEGGHSIQGRTIPMARLVAAAETDAKALEVARHGAQWYLGSHTLARHKPVLTGLEDKHDKRELIANEMFTRSDDDAVETFVKNNVIWGSPDRVRDTIKRLQEEIGLDYLMAAPLGHESFLTFTEKVMPTLVS